MAKSIRQLPIVIDIPTPCAADWEAMTGNAHVRHCALCDKDVHALSELSEAQAVSLLERRDVCVRLQVAPDGAVVHRDRKPASRAARVVATAALAALAACGNQEPATENQVTGSPIAAPLVLDAGAAPTPSASSAAQVPALEPALIGAKQTTTPRPPPSPPFIKHTMGKPMNLRPTMGVPKFNDAKDPL